MSDLSPKLTVTVSIPPDGGLTETAKANRAILAKAYQDIIDGHGTALFELLHPDVEFHEAESLPYAAHFKGIKATCDGVAGMLSHWQSMDVEILEYLAAGDMVIAYIHMKAIGPGGAVYEAPVAELFRFKDGLIVEWRPIYWDTHQARKVLGAA